MNNYYPKATYNNLQDAIDGLRDFLNHKIKVKLTGRIVNFKNPDTYFTLGVENGKSIKVILDHAPADFAKKLKLRENSIVTIEGFLTAFQSENLSPGLQLQGTFITKETYIPKKFYEINRHPLPIMPLDKIAIIGNTNSRGYTDFVTLLSNEISYIPFDTPVEGDIAIKRISSLITEINEKYFADIDLICIVRGGGDKYALQYVFDNAEVCDAVVSSKIPVLVGIGHYEDNYLSIDRVADTPYIYGKSKYSGTPSQLAKNVNTIYYHLKNLLNEPPTNIVPAEIPTVPQKQPVNTIDHTPSITTDSADTTNKVKQKFEPKYLCLLVFVILVLYLYLTYMSKFIIH